MFTSKHAGKYPPLNAYATLITRPTYLAGAILLAYSLHKYSPATPLIILYTPETLSEEAVKAIETESKHSNAIPYRVDHLRVPKPTISDENDDMVAERFIDTWTKIRVFEVLEVRGRKVGELCFLDADMIARRDPSPLVFNAQNKTFLEGGDGRRVCAAHICVCNLDGDAWAPENWRKENCAYTWLPSLFSEELQIPSVKCEPDTMGIFNSGAFVFNPSAMMRDFVLSRFEDMPMGELRAMKFPDQDFLNGVFAGRWASLSWTVNALKTWRYWHTDIWHDDDVCLLHYIVDKPWAARVVRDENGGMKAGYKGNDGVTHSWWWEEFGRWKDERRGQGENELIEAVGQYVAGENSRGDSEEMRVIGGGVQDYAKKWERRKGKLDENEGVTKENGGDGEDWPHGPVLRKHMLGERGHGPVVRN